VVCLAEPVSVSLCGQILLHQHNSRSLYPPPVKFKSPNLKSNPNEDKGSRAANQPSLSTQRTSITSTSSSSTSSTCGPPSRHRRDMDICSTPSAWIFTTKPGTTEHDFRDLLSFLSKNYSLKSYGVELSSPAITFQRFMVKTNDTLASEIKKHSAVS
jgi:hypothetical protein